MRKTAKKLFAVVLAALMLSAVTAVPVSAETPEEECWFHVWEQGDVITPASEGDLGEAVLKCANCGAERTVGIGKKVRGVSIEVLRPLNTELDQRAGRGNDLYEITNVLGKVRLTFEDGSVCRLSYSDLINIYSYDTFEIIDNGLPENPVPGEYTFRFTFLNREYAQRYKVNDTRYVSVSFRDDAPLTMCMTDAEQHVTDVPISFVRETEYSLCVYSLWYSGQPFLYFENAGTQSQPVYTFNGVTAVSPENCAWFKQLKAAEDALVPFTTSMSGGMQKTDISRIEYNGVFTAQNLDAVIENVIVDGFYCQLKDSRLREEIINEEREDYGTRKTIAVYFTPEELKDLLSLYFADVATPDLSLSSKYDASMGAFITARFFSNHPVDNYDELDESFYFEGDRLCCVVNAAWEWVFNGEGKILIGRAFRPVTFLPPQTGIDTDTVKETETGVYVKAGKTAADLLTLAGEGATLTKNGTPVADDAKVGSGMVLTKADGTRETVVVKGDNDGDGAVTAADARFALRTAVMLETPNDWQKDASLVESENTVSAADARLILRAAVGLEDLPLV